MTSQRAQINRFAVSSGGLAAVAEEKSLVRACLTGTTLPLETGAASVEADAAAFLGSRGRMKSGSASKSAGRCCRTSFAPLLDGVQIAHVEYALEHRTDTDFVHKTLVILNRHNRLLMVNMRSATTAKATSTLGVWAAEGFENWTRNFDLSERLRLHYFDVAKGSSTPKNIGF